MLDWMFALLFIFAVLLMIFSVTNADNPFWNIVSIMLSIPLWFILGLSQMELEMPYTAYNASSGNIETGYQVFTSPISPYLTYFFMGVGIVCFIYLIAMIWDVWYTHKQ